MPGSAVSDTPGHSGLTSLKQALSHFFRNFLLGPLRTRFPVHRSLQYSCYHMRQPIRPNIIFSNAIS